MNNWALFLGIILALVDTAELSRFCVREKRKSLVAFDSSKLVLELAMF